MAILTPETHPDHDTIGQRFRSHGAEYVCDSYDTACGFWMTPADPDQPHPFGDGKKGCTAQRFRACNWAHVPPDLPIAQTDRRVTMYREEKWLRGQLFWRSTPNGDWHNGNARTGHFQAARNPRGSSLLDTEVRRT